jgi:predicted Ser/Thr protein kinase
MSDERDQQLAVLLAELSDQVRRGIAPDVAAVEREHPSLAGELRELWAAVLLAEGLQWSKRDVVPPVPLRATALPSILGDYELLEEIGRGGMGIVYRARQKSLGRIVALKMAQRDSASNVELARFRAEAQAAARLQHPHIVPVHEVGEADGRTYFSMQYVEGETLARRLARGPLAAADAAQIVATVARAIEHAHRQGILHRDIKPSNVLIDSQGRPHITDFGLAKQVEASETLTQSGAIIGTPAYMPPEQAAGRRGPLGPASDVYSLGAVLYECLTGRAPFQGATALDTLLMVLEQEPVPPRVINRQADRTLEMICLKCLQKPIGLRYDSAAELAGDLEAFQKGEPVAALSGLHYRLTRLFSETHNAPLLENWGLLWMWHSVFVVVLCSATNVLYLKGVTDWVPYVSLWTIGLVVWSSIFMKIRRRAGPVTFAERQMVHLWAGSTFGCMSLFVIERILHLPVLTLSPVLAILSGLVFLVKASMLSGSFYIWAMACFATALAMAIWPSYGLFMMGLVSGAGFFFPGLKYYRQHAARLAR